ncbi:MAG: 30S ribosomal protein S11 [Bacteroidetes bacterium]|nr:30S ribosomal protein S11 [Bacteroidota bacterium]
MAKTAKVTAKKRVVKVESVGEAHINATFNNIIISITNTTGQVVSWASAGKMGFKGSKTLHNAGLEVTEIMDITPIPHNGCRPPKRRRI